MGNRAVVTFDEKPNKNSIGVYLHWNGGPESILGFCEACDALGVRDGSDSTYQLARFVQIVANFFGGTTSVGVGRLSELDCDNFDNGLFKVSRQGKTLTIEQQPKAGMPFQKLDLDTIRKHVYFHPKNGEQTITEAVVEKNAVAFKEKD